MNEGIRYNHDSNCWVQFFDRGDYAEPPVLARAVKLTRDNVIKIGPEISAHTVEEGINKAGTAYREEA